jgi:hypothetical protein
MIKNFQSSGNATLTNVLKNPCVEAAWNTPNEALRAVEGDEKGTQYLGV